MRAPVFLLAALAVACSSDSSSTSGTNSNPTTPTTPTTNGYSVSVDSVFATRTAMVGTSLPSEVRVSLNGQPAAGVTITWTVSTGGGTANPTTSVTNSAGVAATVWTLSDTVRDGDVDGRYRRRVVGKPARHDHGRPRDGNRQGKRRFSRGRRRE